MTLRREYQASWPWRRTWMNLACKLCRVKGAKAGLCGPGQKYVDAMTVGGNRIGVLAGKICTLCLSEIDSPANANPRYIEMMETERVVKKEEALALQPQPGQREFIFGHGTLDPPGGVGGSQQPRLRHWQFVDLAHWDVALRGPIPKHKLVQPEINEAAKVGVLLDVGHGDNVELQEGRGRRSLCGSNRGKRTISFTAHGGPLRVVGQEAMREELQQEPRCSAACWVFGFLRCPACV